tara:strand:+ start:2055 stop:2816 length:762 start_codon:yes stop_codon:yes gene_type:complete
MATSYRYIVYDIKETLKQNFDDENITTAHILYWVTVTANKLKYQHLKNLQKNFADKNGTFLSVFTEIPIQTFPNNVNPNEVKDRKYIELPTSIMEFGYDGGISYVTFYFEDNDCCKEPVWTKTFAQRTTPAKAHRLYYSSYEEPTPKSPYFYRVDNVLYLLGIECVQVNSMEIGIYTVTNPSEVCSLDSNIDLPDHLISQLKYEVLNLGRYALQFPRDIINEGSPTNSQQAQEALKSAPPVANEAQPTGQQDE